MAGLNSPSAPVDGGLIEHVALRPAIGQKRACVQITLWHGRDPESECYATIESDGVKMQIGPFDRVELLGALQTLHRGLSRL